jgi:hypothetical protein
MSMVPRSRKKSWSDAPPRANNTSPDATYAHNRRPERQSHGSRIPFGVSKLRAPAALMLCVRSIRVPTKRRRKW